MNTHIGFTQITNHTAVAFDRHASQILKKEYWRVCVSFRYYVGYKNSFKWVDVPKGFLTNGADIPRVMWPILPRHGEYDQAIALHDYLCENRTISTPTGLVTLNRKQIDYIFYEALRVLKIAKWKLIIIRGGTDLYRWMNSGRYKVPTPNKLHLQTASETTKFFEGFVPTPNT